MSENHEMLRKYKTWLVTSRCSEFHARVGSDGQTYQNIHKHEKRCRNKNISIWPHESVFFLVAEILRIAMPISKKNLTTHKINYFIFSWRLYLTLSLRDYEFD